MTNNYGPDELASRKAFLRLLQSACDELGVHAHWLEGNWIAELRKGTARCLVSGYSFPLNNGVTANIFRDKSATAAVLRHRGVAAIAHHLVRMDHTHQSNGVTERVLNMVALPLVIKPNFGEAGVDVYQCTTQEELATAVGTLARRHQSLAVGPLVAIAHEYRVVMLDNRALLMFEKIRAAGQWQHNLALGATPHIIDDPALQAQLLALAQSALSALGGRLGVVDIAATKGGLQVMEINGGVTLSHFSQHSAEYHRRAVAVYREIIIASLGLQSR